MITSLTLLKFTLSNTSTSADFTSCSIENEIRKCPSNKPVEFMYRRMFPTLQSWFEKVAMQHRNSEIQRLSEIFPLDPITENHVREVRNAVFSKINPTPLKTTVKLAGVSADALGAILDLDVEVAKSQDFVEVPVISFFISSGQWEQLYK
jgi:hypothetical protein